MKITVKSRMTALLPSVQFGNISLEAGIELEQELTSAGDLGHNGVTAIEVLQETANSLVLNTIKEQRKAVDDELERSFFKISV